MRIKRILIAIFLCTLLTACGDIHTTQEKNPLAFCFNVGTVNPEADQYIKQGYSGDKEINGSTVSRSDNDTVIVEFEGQVYGNPAVYDLYCSDDGIISFIYVDVMFESESEMLDYYRSLCAASNERYGSGTVHDKGTDEEQTSYILNEDEDKRIIAFISPNVLELDNTYYYVNITASRM